MFQISDFKLDSSEGVEISEHMYSEPESVSNLGNNCARDRGPGGTMGARRGSPEGPRGPKKGPGKVATQERAKEGKGRCGLCLRRRKEEKHLKGPLGAPRGPRKDPTQSQGGPGGQKNVRLVKTESIEGT
jgi:hypothetical protein